MRYISNTPAQQREMLATIGVGSIEDLLAHIPAKARLSRPLNVPAAMAESDLIRHLRRLSAKNANADDFACFLGGGSYDHTIPSPINHLILRGEFFTAYTPYQPEASQGTLRSIFEYQTMMAELTGMDVANASLYDGASAVAEAVLMAHAVTERKAAVISKGVNPLYRQVVETYCEGPAIRLKSAPLAEGVTDLDALRKSVSAQTAAVVVQYPNFFGCLEDVKAAAEIAHAAGALLIVVADPVNLGLLTPPGALGADLVVGEGQGLGVPMSFGGPNLGVFAAKQELVRRMPGRLVGATVDLDGKRGFVLTLQTREQHIRREKATSNICTAQALNALAGAIYLSWLGREGFVELATLMLQRTAYARQRLSAIDGVELVHEQPVTREFAITVAAPVQRVVEHCRERGVNPGVALGRDYPEFGDSLLVAITEQRTRSDIDRLADALEAALAAHARDYQEAT